MKAVGDFWAANPQFDWRHDGPHGYAGDFVPGYSLRYESLSYRTSLSECIIVVDEMDPKSDLLKINGGDHPGFDIPDWYQIHVKPHKRWWHQLVLARRATVGPLVAFALRNTMTGRLALQDEADAVSAAMAASAIS